LLGEEDAQAHVDLHLLFQALSLTVRTQGMARFF